MTNRSGSMPLAAPTCSNSRSRTARQARVDGAAAHPRLARRRRRAGRADLGVDRVEHDDVDAEHRAGDLLGDRDEALPDLRRGELQRRHAVGQLAARRRVVVEALGVHEVLDRHAVADAAPHVADVGGQAGAAGQAHRVDVAGWSGDSPIATSGIGSAAVSRMQRATGRHALDDLPGDQAVAGLHGVAQAELDRVEPARRGEPVHLALVGEARLHDAEAAHRPARQVVGAHGDALDDGVRAPVRALGLGDAVEQHGRRRRRVGPAVEHEAGLDLDDLAVRRGVVAHPDRRRVAVDVAEEALGAAVRDAHRPAEPQREQAGVDLQADVLAGAERAADAAEHEPDALLGEAEAGGDLLAVLVQPLRGDVQLDAAAVVVGDRHRRLEAEERLVLHADLVRALDDDVAGRVGVAAADHLVAEDVAVGVDRRVAAVDRPPRGRSAARAPRTSRRSRRAPAGTSRGGRRPPRRPARRRSARRPSANTGWSGAIRPYVSLAGHVGGGEDRGHAGDRPAPCDVSMATMRAYGCGERSVAPHAAPSIGRSDENANMPWALMMPSGRAGESPIRPVPTLDPLIRSSSVTTAPPAPRRPAGRPR